MTTENLNKRVGAWVIMDVEAVQTMSMDLIRILGPVIESNFLVDFDTIGMPVVAKAFKDFPIGERIKLVFFTKKNDLDDFRANKSAGFVDDGIRYYKWTSEGWEMIYEG